ncbi:MAG: peptidoglycan-binding domain-containing protein [Myxococcota bacterium]
MSSVRLSSLRNTTPAKAQPAVSRPGTEKKAVDGFERRSTTAQVLQRGMTGPAVTALQQKLVAARFMSVSDLRSGPGVYGPRTEAAVKRLQQHVGLPLTGVAGPSTMAALSSGARFQPAPTPPEPTRPMARPLAKLSETFSDEVTQPMGVPL